MQKLNFVFLMALILVFITGVTCAEEELTYNQWIDYVDYELFPLTEDNLSLPENGFKDFSTDAQKELLDMASLYGDINVDKRIINIDGDEEEIETMYFHPIPGLELNADYGQKIEDLEMEKWTNININYKLNEKTILRAGYGFASSESVDLIEKENIEDDNVTERNNIGDDGVNIIDNINSQLIYNTEKNNKKNLGISYQTSDHLTLSADYVSDKIDSVENEGDESTILGIEYREDGGELKAQYQVGNRETITGIEFALSEMAVSASYKLLNTKMLEEQLNKEKIWDFGMAVNLSDVSTLSLGYQFRENIDQKNIEDDKKEEEKSVEASFKIDF